MGGGLIQLAAYGVQDIYLTGKPEITFFKSVYRRYTNFATEMIKQNITNQVKTGSVVSITLSRSADLISDIMLSIDNYNTYAKFLPPEDRRQSPPGYYGFCLIDYVELVIGGKPISRIYGEWMMVWAELTLRKNTNRDPLEACMRQPLFFENDKYKTQEVSKYRNQFPLLFWFHNNPGLALPLVALQYDDVILNLRFKDIDSLRNQTFLQDGDDHGTPIVANQPFVDYYEWLIYELEKSDFWLYAEYVYLDTDESKQFAQNSHDYLIEQVQFVEQPNTASNIIVNLNFNYTVKNLLWYASGSDIVIQAEPGYFTPSKYAPLLLVPNSYEYGTLVLNGHNRFAKRKISYFERYQVYKNFPGLSPIYNTYPQEDNKQPFLALPLSVYSFAINPSEFKPSGTCNFSIIQDARLVLENVPQFERIASIKVWAQSYNILKIVSGQAGLAYSN